MLNGPAHSILLFSLVSTPGKTIVQMIQELFCGKQSRNKVCLRNRSMSTFILEIEHRTVTENKNMNIR